MKQHILVISQYFYPEQFRINDICMEWVKKGYEVTVITGIPNYPQGKFYKGYGVVKKRKEEYEGIHIIRLPIIARGKNALMMILNYLSFAVSGLFWSIFTKIRADKVFMFEVSPMTQALVGVWYTKRIKIPCYIYVQDLWPENVETVTGIHNRVIIGSINKMVDYIYSHCNKIFATSPSFVKRIEERQSAFQGGKSKCIYWPQYAEDYYQPVSKESLPDMEEDDSFKIVFTGNIGYAQGLDILPKVAVLLKKENCNCRFYIIGDGRYRQKFEREIVNMEVGTMFRMLGRKKPQEIPRYMAHCDAAFLSFEQNALFEMTIPAKLQSYMACGIPILAAASGETRRILEEARVGYCVDENDSDGMLKIIKEMMDSSSEERIRMSHNALQYCMIHFNKYKLLEQMNEFI